jgi:hypothetical protein
MLENTVGGFYYLMMKIGNPIVRFSGNDVVGNSCGFVDEQFNLMSLNFRRKKG